MGKEAFEVINGDLYASSMANVAAAMGCHRITVNDWIRQGCPGKTDHGYCIPRVLEWARLSGPWRDKSTPSPDDPLLGDGPPTEALERLRLVSAKIKELDYAQKKSELVPAEDLRVVLTESAARIRQAGEALGRRFGPDAQQILNEAIDAAGELIDRIGEDINEHQT